MQYEILIMLGVFIQVWCAAVVCRVEHTKSLYCLLHWPWVTIRWLLENLFLMTLENIKLSRKTFIFKKFPAILAMFGSMAEGLNILVLLSVSAGGRRRGFV